MENKSKSTTPEELMEQAVKGLIQRARDSDIKSTTKTKFSETRVTQPSTEQEISLSKVDREFAVHLDDLLSELGRSRFRLFHPEKSLTDQEIDQLLENAQKPQISSRPRISRT